MKIIPVSQYVVRTSKNLRCADKTALIAPSEKDLQTLLDIINEESERVGLSLNMTKTVTVVIYKNDVTPVCNIALKNSLLQQVRVPGNKHIQRRKIFARH